MDYEKWFDVTAVYTDRSVRMGAAQALYLLQDGMTECLAGYGCSNIELKKKYNAFWVVVRAKVRFYRFAAWNERVRLTMRPETSGRLRMELRGRLYDENGALLLESAQEMCALDRERHRPVKIAGFGLPEGEGRTDFSAFDKAAAPLCYEIPARGQTIDMSGHVNNVAYVRLALDTFDSTFWMEHPPREIEAHYLKECKENTLLSVCKADTPDGAFCRVTREGESVFEMKILF